MAGTGGVVAFVGILVVAVRRAGFSRPPALGPRRSAISRRSPGSPIWGVRCIPARRCCWARRSSPATALRAGWSRIRSRSRSFSRRTPFSRSRSSRRSFPRCRSPRWSGDLDAFARSIRWALDRSALARDSGVGGSGRDRAADDASRRVRQRGEDRAGAAGGRYRIARARAVSLRRVPAARTQLLRARRQRTPALVAIGSAMLGVA